MLWMFSLESNGFCTLFSACWEHFLISSWWNRFKAPLNKSQEVSKKQKLTCLVESFSSQQTPRLTAHLLNNTSTHFLKSIDWSWQAVKKLLMCGATVSLRQPHHASEVSDVRGHYSLPMHYWWPCWCVNVAGLWGDVLMFLFYFSAHTSKLI